MRPLIFVCGLFFSLALNCFAGPSPEEAKKAIEEDFLTSIPGSTCSISDVTFLERQGDPQKLVFYFFEASVDVSFKGKTTSFKNHLYMLQKENQKWHASGRGPKPAKQTTWFDPANASLYSPTVADETIKAACRQAADEGKSVFVKWGTKDCAPCVAFDKFLETPEIRRVFEKYYILVSIDPELMADGQEVFNQFAKLELTSWVILTPQKKVIVNSFAPGEGNVGYPAHPDEVTYFLGALKKAAPALTDDESDILARHLAGKREK